MLAAAAAIVVVAHDALADAGLLLGHAGADGGDDAAGLMASDRSGLALDAARDGAGFRRRGTVGVQVRAAHARRLDLQHDVPRARGRIGKVAQLEFAVTQENDASHGNFLRLDRLLSGGPAPARPACAIVRTSVADAGWPAYAPRQMPHATGPPRSRSPVTGPAVNASFSAGWTPAAADPGSRAASGPRNPGGRGRGVAALAPPA